MYFIGQRLYDGYKMFTQLDVTIQFTAQVWAFDKLFFCLPILYFSFVEVYYYITSLCCRIHKYLACSIFRVLSCCQVVFVLSLVFKNFKFVVISSFYNAPVYRMLGNLNLISHKVLFR